MDNINIHARLTASLSYMYADMQSSTDEGLIVHSFVSITQC